VGPLTQFFVGSAPGVDCDTPAVDVQVADAVVAALGSGSFCLGFEAVRDYVPVHELDDLSTLKVTVVPAGLALNQISRAPQHLHDYVVDLGIQQRIGQGAMTRLEILAACDPLRRFVQDVLDLFRGRPLELADGSRATCIAAANNPIFAPKHLDEKRVFTSVLSLTYRLVR
jgi:hypothetical protein